MFLIVEVAVLRVVAAGLKAIGRQVIEIASITEPARYQIPVATDPATHLTVPGAYESPIVTSVPVVGSLQIIARL